MPHYSFPHVTFRAGASRVVPPATAMPAGNSSSAGAETPGMLRPHGISNQVTPRPLCRLADSSIRNDSIPQAARNRERNGFALARMIQVMDSVKAERPAYEPLASAIQSLAEDALSGRLGAAAGHLGLVRVRLDGDAWVHVAGAQRIVSDRFAPVVTGRSSAEVGAQACAGTLCAELLGVEGFMQVPVLEPDVQVSALVNQLIHALIECGDKDAMRQHLDNFRKLAKALPASPARNALTGRIDRARVTCRTFNVERAGQYLKAPRTGLPHVVGNVSDMRARDIETEAQKQELRKE